MATDTEGAPTRLSPLTFNDPHSDVGAFDACRAGPRQSLSDPMDVPSADAAAQILGPSPEPASAPPEVAPNSGQPGTILSIQILRFVAALSVVLFHAHVAL